MRPHRGDRSDASAALAVHGRERRIGHDHLVAEGLEVLRYPLALGRRLDQNPHRASAFEQGRESIAGRRDASVERLTALRDDPDLTVFLVEIDGTILHGWSSPVRLNSAGQQCGAQATTSLRRPAASS
jgi:hypothetical protein